MRLRVNCRQQEREDKCPGDIRKPQNHLQFSNVSLHTTIIGLATMETKTDTVLRSSIVAEDTNQITSCANQKESISKRQMNEREKSVYLNGCVCVFACVGIYRSISVFG